MASAQFDQETGQVYYISNDGGRYSTMEEARAADGRNNVATGAAPAPAAAPTDPGPPPDDSGLWVVDRDSGKWELPTANQAKHVAWQQQQRIGGMAEDLAAKAPTFADVREEFGFDPMAAANSRDPRVDLSALDPYRAERAAALGDQRKVLQFALGLEGPQQLTPQERDALEQRFAERALRTANTAASSARGGAGAVSAARLGVNQQLPAISGEAALQATNAANAEFANRVNAFNSRVGQANVAGSISNVIGNTATNAFGQELQGQTAAANVDLGKLGIDLQAQGLVKSMATDLLGLQYDYAKLPLEVQTQILDDMTKRYGIDVASATQLKAAAAANKKGPLDYLTTLFKVGTDVASAASGLGLFTRGAETVARTLDTSNPYA